MRVFIHNSITGSFRSADELLEEEDPELDDVEDVPDFETSISLAIEMRYVRTWASDTNGGIKTRTATMNVQYATLLYWSSSAARLIGSERNANHTPANAQKKITIP